MPNTRVPRVARVHFDSIQQLWRVVVSYLDEIGLGGTPGEVLDKVLTLAQVIAFIVDTWGAPPTGLDSVPSAVLGDMGALAQHLIQTFSIVGHPPTTSGQQTMPGEIVIPGEGKWTWTSL